MTTFLNTTIYTITAVLFIILVTAMFVTAFKNILSGIPYVPTRKKYINQIIKLADLKKGEKVYDLGCGDGRILEEASKRTGTEAIGFETAPIPYFLAKLRKLIFKGNFVVLMKDFFSECLKDADVIYCYLGPEAMIRLAPKFLKECKKGTRIYSNAFSMKVMQPKKFWAKNKDHPNVYFYEI